MATTVATNARSLIAGSVFVSLLLVAFSAAAQDLPVLEPNLPSKVSGVRNPVTFDQIHNIVGPSEDGSGFVLDLNDSSYWGWIYSGPFPLAGSDIDYSRYRIRTPLRNGKGVIHCRNFFTIDRYNPNHWPAETMTVAYRLELFRTTLNGQPKPLGFYDSLLSFTLEPAPSNKTDAGRRLRKVPTIVEGPFVCMVRSDNPTEVLLTWRTDEPCTAELVLWKLPPTQATVQPACSQSHRTGSLSQIDCPAACPPPNQPPTARISSASRRAVRQHELWLRGLAPNTTYAYRLQCTASDGRICRSRCYRFQTAPEKGKMRVVFVFASDSREGVGSGERNYMGHNRYILRQIVRQAYRRRADFIIFGGDLVNGYTSQSQDFRLQIQAWKQTVAAFWHHRPVYPAMGNHETLLNVYSGLAMDKWPYPTHSAEAVFAEQFWNPRNGPKPADPRRPSYAETVYYFQYGPVLCISFNNNYWWTTNHKCSQFGGCPEGYLMEDQLGWLEQQLQRAEEDDTIKYVVLYAQEPVFPCGGHLKDAMWYNGNNSARAYTYRKGKLVPEKAGIIQVRNRFWTAVARCSKVAAVLVGDEHAYYRLLIDNRTAVGVMALDDSNGNNKLDDGRISPNPAFKYPTWHITAGTAGAPYYAPEKAPWTPTAWSAQPGYCLFVATRKKISMTYYSITGQVVDRVDDLMAVKSRKSP